MMWYTPPYQKEFFGYFDHKSELVWGEPRTLSRAKPSDALVDAQAEISRRWWIWRRLPYVEQVCISGWLSFDASYDQDVQDIWLRIITSRGRMWSTYAMVRLVLWMINLLQSRHKRLRFGISAVMSEEQLYCGMLKKPEYDPIIIYQLAHLSLRYQRYDDVSRNIYTSNEWILEYLPNFPLQYVIWLWIEHVYGKKPFALHAQQVFAYRWWSMLNWICKWVTVWIHVLKTKMWFSNTFVWESLIRKDERKKDIYILKWKLLRTTTKSGWQ